MQVKYFVEQEDSETKQRVEPKFICSGEVEEIKHYDQIEHGGQFYQVMGLQFDLFDKNIINAYCYEIQSLRKPEISNNK